MKAAVIAALAIPVLSAAAQDYTSDYTKSCRQADTWQACFQQVHDDLKALGVNLTEPEFPAEIPVTEDTVAVADKGLLFNTSDSALIYLGNVRMRDARAHINASEQLHIYLEALTVKSDDADTPPASSQPAPTAKPAAAPVSAAASPTPSTKSAPQKAPAPEQKENAVAEPALINTHSAVADSVNNNIFLYSPAAGQEIFMRQGKNFVRIKPTTTTPARILADPQGNILLEGGLIDICASDKEGGFTKLKSSGGFVYYHAATHTVHAPGGTDFSHPSGTLNCTNGLRLVLTPSAGDNASRKGFMSQFTGLRFDGIDTATAKGQVVMTGAAAEGRPAMLAEGDTLVYNGKTGECTLLGTRSRLQYGGYDIYSNEGLYLLPNGDIELRGSDIHGTYEREGDTPGQMISGTFKAHANIIFCAETGTISTAKGITMADAETDFSCSGPATLVLSPKENAKVPEQKPGMPNLAITRFGDVSRIHATGNVIAHRYEPGTHRCTSELKAKSVESDLISGETLLTGETGQPLIALHEGNRIIAVPAADRAATMQMLANGDLRLNGAEITATMVNEDGTTTASCNDYVRLIRAENRLETGSSTKLNAPTAILTTNGPLNAILATSDDTPPAPAKPGISGFRFNYNGIQEATTANGCTLRTEQGSMQCTGPVHIVMDAEAQDTDSEFGGIKHATATGNVAIAGKDKSGRLLRATGDRLTIDAATGMKVLTGRRVTLGDANNTHIITGDGAAIRIDAKNNVKISGGSHKTHATNVRQQLNNPNNKKIKK